MRLSITYNLSELQNFVLSEDKLGITHIDDITETDMEYVRKLGLLELTSLFDIHNISYSARRAKKKQKGWFFISSHEHNYSRGAFRVVMCPSCVVNNFFKYLLLSNRLANLDQTWQECSLGDPLQKLFTEFDSIKNSGCHGNEIEFFKQFFKNLLLCNHWSDFEIISQECSLGDPF